MGQYLHRRGPQGSETIVNIQEWNPDQSSQCLSLSRGILIVSLYRLSTHHIYIWSPGDKGSSGSIDDSIEEDIRKYFPEM